MIVSICTLDNASTCWESPPHCYKVRSLRPTGRRLSLSFASSASPTANFETLEWLEYHAQKLLRQARALEAEIAKFKTTSASVTDLAKKRSNGRGTHNLRWIASKIEVLKKELQQVREFGLIVHICG